MEIGTPETTLGHLDFESPRLLALHELPEAKNLELDVGDVRDFNADDATDCHAIAGCLPRENGSVRMLQAER